MASELKLTKIQFKTRLRKYLNKNAYYFTCMAHGVLTKLQATMVSTFNYHHPLKNLLMSD